MGIGRSLTLLLFLNIIALSRIRSLFVRSMAWTCHSETNAGLVENLRNANIIKSESVYNAMLATDRAHYLGRYSNGADAYQDSPQYIGHAASKQPKSLEDVMMGNTFKYAVRFIAISAPHMHAHALEALVENLQPGNRVLDVGCGSGYLSSVMKRMVGTSGTVISIDYIDKLVEMSRENIGKDDQSLLEGPGAIKLETRDGWKGAAEYGPFDAIHVGAAAKSMPQDLVAQLAPNGKMVIPVGPEGQHQTLYLVSKDPDGKNHRSQDMMGVVYVPLVVPSEKKDPASPSPS